MWGFKTTVHRVWSQLEPDLLGGCVEPVPDTGDMFEDLLGHY